MRPRHLALALLAGGAAASGVAPSALACSVCGCGDPLVDASDSVPHASRFRLALDVEYLTASARMDEDPAGTESVTQETLRPVFVYSPTEALNFVLQVPFTRKDWSTSGLMDNSQAVNTGLGDLDLGARWFFWRSTDMGAQSRQALGVSAGITAPTGADDAKAGADRLDDHAQLGTGSWGPYVGAVYAYHRDPWNAFASITLRGHTTNSFDYH